MEIGPLIYHLRCDLPRHLIARRYYLDKLISAYTLKEVKALLRLKYVREVWSSQVVPFLDVAAMIESIQEGDNTRIWPLFYCCDPYELRKQFERLRDDPATFDALKAWIPKLYPIISKRPMAVAEDGLAHAAAATATPAGSVDTQPA